MNKKSIAGSGSFILNLACTGVVPTKEQTPHVPLTISEIEKAVEDAMVFGITSVHVHGRDAQGHPTSDPGVYENIVSTLRRRWPELVICVSCTSRAGAGFEERAAVLDLDGDSRPDMASLTLSSMNFINEPSINDLDTVIALATRMKDRGIKPEIEIFDLGMVNVLRTLYQRGILKPPFFVNVLLGNLATAQVDLLHLAALTQGLPEDTLWSVAGIGRGQLRANMAGLLFGYGVRTGLEDNLWWDEERSRLTTNAELVERIHVLGKQLGRSCMTSKELRMRLNLGNGESQK